MGLDQLLELTSSVSIKLLPILGVIAFIFLIIFLKRLITVISNANHAVDSMKETISLTNHHLESLDKPLKTLNELSETVDSVHEASKNAVKSALVAIVENFSTIKEWVFAKTQKESTFDEEYSATDRSDEDGSNEPQ